MELSCIFLIMNYALVLFKSILIVYISDAPYHNNKVFLAL